jgi:hypothetical protein
MEDPICYSDLRVIIATSDFFIADDVSWTIRGIVKHLRSVGAAVKILTSVPDNIPAEDLQDIIEVPGTRIPCNYVADYTFSVGLDETTLTKMQDFQPNCVHFTVPDLVTLDGIRWCQQNNIAYLTTWHFDPLEFLEYYNVRWIFGCFVGRYLKGLYEQIPSLYVPSSNVNQV